MTWISSAISRTKIAHPARSVERHPVDAIAMAVSVCTTGAHELADERLIARAALDLSRRAGLGLPRYGRPVHAALCRGRMMRLPKRPPRRQRNTSSSP
jgi:hypothetical protein